ncbi:MAG TPA: DUF1579 domain-containing protein [Geobacteraceae bacterium]
MARESAQRKAPSAMDTYADVATPGAPHKLLARMAGTWSMKGSCRMEPGGDLIDHTGSSEQRMILDGRFLQQDFRGQMMGISFTGMGFTGYDNHKEKYVSTWLDSFGTGIYHFEGTGSADGRTITQTCSYDDPVRGPLTLRNVTRIVDDNTFEFRMYTTASGGKEEEMAVLVYTRTA